MTVKLLTEHNLEFLSLKGGRKGSSESTLVKMPHCWKSHVMAHLYNLVFNLLVASNYPVVEVLLPSGAEIQQCTADTCVKVGIWKMMRPNKKYLCNPPLPKFTGET